MTTKLLIDALIAIHRKVYRPRGAEFMWVMNEKNLDRIGDECLCEQKPNERVIPSNWIPSLPDYEPTFMGHRIIIDETMPEGKIGFCYIFDTEKLS
jgi:hypothetical protein